MKALRQGYVEKKTIVFAKNTLLGDKMPRLYEYSGPDIELSGEHYWITPLDEWPDGMGRRNEPVIIPAAHLLHPYWLQPGDIIAGVSSPDHHYEIEGILWDTSRVQAMVILVSQKDPTDRMWMNDYELRNVINVL